MRLEQLIYCLEVAKEGNITKAAKNLYIAQPTLSNAIATLEEELGIEIFKRSRSGTELTLIGRNIMIKAQNIANEIQSIEHLALRDKEVDKNKITLLSIPLFCHNFIIDSMITFKEAYANVHIMINETVLEDIVIKMVKKEADLALIAYVSEIKSVLLLDLQRQHLQMDSLFQDVFCIFAHRDHPLALKKSVSIKDMFQYDVVIFGNYRYKNIQTTDETSNTLEHHTCCYIHDKESVKQMVKAHRYLTMMPSFIYANDPDLLSGLVVQLPIHDFNQYFEVAILTNPAHQLSHMEKRFFDIAMDNGRVMREAFSQHIAGSSAHWVT